MRDYVLFSGNEACAEAAIYAGCRFFAGYPITPASEIAEHLAKRLPEVNGVYVQMEDEIASMAAVIGASWAGVKSMTATSGPGFSLMQENISYAYMTETPCVVVDVQRSGPSTGQATMPSQQDVYQARYGAHGDYESIVLCPWSVQETFYLTVRAFNLSEKFRVPVILLSDEVIGHMRENFLLPSEGEVEVIDRIKPERDLHFEPFGAKDPSMVPPMPSFGEGYRLLVTGSAHRENGVRDYTPSVHQKLLERITKKILNRKEEIVEIETRYVDDAKTILVCYGSVARPALGAVELARKHGLKVGMIRLKTLWPFPDDEIAGTCEEVEKIYVPEMNMGKIVREVKRCVGNVEVTSIPKVGGVIHGVKEIYQWISSGGEG